MRPDVTRHGAGESSGSSSGRTLLQTELRHSCSALIEQGCVAMVAMKTTRNTSEARCAALTCEKRESRDLSSLVALEFISSRR